jgi:hypothetical protein
LNGGVLTRRWQRRILPLNHRRCFVDADFRRIDKYREGAAGGWLSQVFNVDKGWFQIFQEHVCEAMITRGEVINKISKALIGYL